MAFGRKRKDPFAEIQACLQKRDYKGALDWFNTLLQKDRKNTQIRLRFADTLVLAGNKREAVKQYRIVADELADKGFMIRAIAINKKILQLDPNQAEVHDKLAAMKEERSGTGAATATRKTGSSLAEVLRQPDAPLRRAEEKPAPAPAPPPAQAKPETPDVLPELSLEESMAMEFGTADATEAAEARQAPPGEPPIPAPPPAEEPEPVTASGGFNLEEEEAEAEAPPVSSEPPTFAEEPMDFGGGAAEPEPDIEISLDGVEAPPQSPEIVLDVVEASVEETPEIQVEATVAGGGDEASDDVVILADDESGEIEVIAFELDDADAEDAALPADGVETMIGALGEDIDSLIDSIIDDVGSSAVQAGEEETPAPTHIPLFSDLTSSEFVDVALLLVRRVAKVGETIVKEGDPGESMFIVSHGEVRATITRDGKQVAVATMKDGDFFGEMAVLSGEPRNATCTAVKATELLELSRDNLGKICSRHPHVEAKIRLAYDERMTRFQTQ